MQGGLLLLYDLQYEICAIPRVLRLFPSVVYNDIAFTRHVHIGVMAALCKRRRKLRRILDTQKLLSLPVHDYDRTLGQDVVDIDL